MDVQLSTLKQVGQPVIDFDRAVTFYRETLRLPLIAETGALAFFDLDGVRLLLERPEDVDAPRAGDSPPSCGVLYFDVADVHTARDLLARRGVEFEHDPHLIHRDDAGTFGRAGAETWMVFFRDTEGNMLAIACSDQPPGP